MFLWILSEKNLIVCLKYKKWNKLYVFYSKFIETLTTRYLGGTLYPKVLKLTNSFVVGKITGMLLEIDKIEVVQLINDEIRLAHIVREALEVLRRAWVNDKNLLSKLPY